MNTKTIRIDAEVYRRLQEIAAERKMQFDSPNAVLRIVLDLPPRSTQRHWPKR